MNGSTRYWFISDSAIIFLHKSLKHFTSSLVGFFLPSRNKDRADTYLGLASPKIKSANISSGASSDKCHGGRCKVFLIKSCASFLFVSMSLASGITSPRKPFYVLYHRGVEKKGSRSAAYEGGLGGKTQGKNGGGNRF
jgi:hypothetical protein